MLENPAVGIFIDKAILPVKKLPDELVDCEPDRVHLIVGFKVNRNAVAKALIPVRYTILEVFQKIPIQSEDFKDLLPREHTALHKLLVLMDSIPYGLYPQGFLIQTLNTDDLVQVNPEDLLNFLESYHRFLQSKAVKLNPFSLRDLIVLYMNKVTYTKIGIRSVRMGETVMLTYRSNLLGVIPHNEINTEFIFALSRIYNESDPQEGRIIENTYRAMTETIDRFRFSYKNSNGGNLDTSPDEFASGLDEMALQVRVMVPLGYVNFENPVNRKESSRKFLVKLNSRICMQFFINDRILFKELDLEVKRIISICLSKRFDALISNRKELDLGSSTVWEFEALKENSFSYKGIRFEVDCIGCLCTLSDVVDLIDDKDVEITIID